MKRSADDLLREALELPPAARAALAGSPISSLDADVDEGAEATWETEILHRLHEIDTGKVKLVPWAEARRRIVGQ